MRHHRSNRTLSRTAIQRKALLRSLSRELILKEQIQTTEAKAKEVRPFVEKLITNAKKENIPAIRHIESQIGAEARKRLMNDVLPRYSDRHGGYTRITKLPYRHSDSASMALIELIN